MLKNKKILITGGTGSFGKAYTHFLLENESPQQVVIFSRDEQKHYDMKREFAQYGKQIRFVIGDIRDREKVFDVCKSIDLIVHSAAMKHLPMAEENPLEAIKTNILGTQNLIDAAIYHGVAKVVTLSTDKAALPINTYGGTKLLLEKLLHAGDAHPENKSTRFTTVRYANVFGTKGSVIPLFMKLKTEGVLPITHPDMSRFSITLQQGIDLVQYAFDYGQGGEIIVPIAPSYTVKSIAEAVCPTCEQKNIGIRDGEKMHEILVTSFEANRTLKHKEYYIIAPESGRLNLSAYMGAYNGSSVVEFEEYSSGSNTQWLTTAEIKSLIHDLYNT